MSAKQSVWSDGYLRPAHYGQYSQALIVPPGYGTLYTTGMCAFDADGTLAAPGDAATQTRIIFQQLREILAEAGSSLDDVVQLIIFVSDYSDLAAIGDARAEIWTKDPPASSTIKVELAAEGICLEVLAVALVPPR